MNVFPRKKEKEKNVSFSVTADVVVVCSNFKRGSSSTSSRWCLNLQEVKAGNAKTTKLLYKVGMIF